MSNINFKDCEYRYLDGDLLRCSNMKSPNDDLCDNCKENIHLNCDNYSPNKDLKSDRFPPSPYGSCPPA